LGRTMSVLIVAGLLVVVAAAAILIKAKGEDWWAPALPPLGALVLLLLGAVIRRPDKPLEFAIAQLIDLPARRPRIGAAMTISVCLVAGLLANLARLAAASEEQFYIVQLYDRINISEHRVPGITVIMERTRDRNADAEEIRRETDRDGIASFPVAVNDLISLRLERPLTEGSREVWIIEPGANMDGEALLKPKLVNLNDQLWRGVWTKFGPVSQDPVSDKTVSQEPVSENTGSQETGSQETGSQETGSAIGLEFASKATVEMHADRYFFRWTDGMPQQPPQGPEQIENTIAPFGVPQAEITIRRPAYILGFSPYLRLPRWVASRIAHEVGRRWNKDYQIDPAVPQGVQATFADYHDIGFDRGHLAALRDTGVTPEMSDSVSMMTAVAPQTPALNRKIWRQIENFTSDLGRTDGHDVYVIRGPMFLPSEGSENLKVWLIGAGRLPVPTHFFQVALDRTPQGLQMHCFIVPNQPTYNELDGPERAKITEIYRAPLSRIEDGTGLKLLPDLDRTLAPGC
jgi:DNA/RNA endonuclease G (NUC1)